MGFVYLAFFVVLVFAPWLFRCLVADLADAHAALVAAFRARRSTFRERLRRSGPWFWRAGGSL